MKTYNKLVRDNIPQIIVKSGKTFKIKILDQNEFQSELKKKLVEESKELQNANTKEEMINELADIYEVLDYIIMDHKIDLLEVKKRRIQKNMKNGAFDERIYLEYVKE